MTAEVVSSSSGAKLALNSSLRWLIFAIFRGFLYFFFGGLLSPVPQTKLNFRFMFFESKGTSKLDARPFAFLLSISLLCENSVPETASVEWTF